MNELQLQLILKGSLYKIRTFHLCLIFQPRSEQRMVIAVLWRKEVGLGLSKVLKKVLKKVNLLKKVLKKVNLLKKALKKALKKVNLLKKGLKKEQPVKKVNSRKCIHSKK